MFPYNSAHTDMRISLYRSLVPPSSQRGVYDACRDQRLNETVEWKNIVTVKRSIDYRLRLLGNTSYLGGLA